MHINIDGPPKAVEIAGIGALLCLIGSVVWIELDARRRGKSGVMAVIFLFAATWPFSILWWLWLRPPLPVAVQPNTALKPPPVPNEDYR